MSNETSSANDEFFGILKGIDFKETYTSLTCIKCENFRKSMRKVEDRMRSAWGFNAYDYAQAIKQREVLMIKIGEHFRYDHMIEKEKTTDA